MFKVSMSECNIFYVYILETTANSGKKSFYTGYTKDLFRRWTEHRKGTGAKFCRGKKDIELKYFETFTDRSTAMRRELEIKTFSRQKKQQLIQNFDS